MESPSHKPSAKLQSREQQTTKPAANVHSGVNDTKQADTIMAAHGSQQIATGQSDTYESDITQWQVAASAVTIEDTTGTHAQHKSSKKSSRTTNKKGTTASTHDSHAHASGSNNKKTAPVTASQTEVLDKAPTQTHSTATKGTGNKIDLSQTLLCSVFWSSCGSCIRALSAQLSCVKSVTNDIM